MIVITPCGKKFQSNIDFEINDINNIPINATCDEFEFAIKYCVSRGLIRGEYTRKERHPSTLTEALIVYYLASLYKKLDDRHVHNIFAGVPDFVGVLMSQHSIYGKADLIESAILRHFDPNLASEISGRIASVLFA